MFGLFGSKTETGVDPHTAEYIKRYREAVERYGQGLGQSAGPFSTDQISHYMNPYERDVVGGLRGDFDYQRGQALQAANDAAMRGSAFGGNRHGALLGAAMGAVNRDESQALANLRYQGWQGALGQLNADRSFGLSRDQLALGSMQAGMTPISQYTKQSGNIFGQIAGLGLSAAGMGLFGGGRQAPASAGPMPNLPSQYPIPQWPTYSPPGMGVRGSFGPSIYG